MKRTNPLSQYGRAYGTNAERPSRATKANSDIVPSYAMKLCAAGLIGSAALVQSPLPAFAETGETMPVLPYILGATSAFIAAGAAFASWKLIEKAYEIRDGKNMAATFEDPARTGRITMDAEIENDPQIDYALSILEDESTIVSKTMNEPFDATKNDEFLPAREADDWIDALVASLYEGSSSVNHDAASDEKEPEDSKQTIDDARHLDNSTSSESNESGMKNNELPTKEFIPAIESPRIYNGQVPDRYSAPVIGPRSMSVGDIERRLEMLDISNEPAAVRLRERNAQFRFNHPRTEEQYQRPMIPVVPEIQTQKKHSETGFFSTMMRKVSKDDTADVPVIARGAGSRRITVPEIEPESQTFAPSAYSIAAASAAVAYGIQDFAPQFGSDYAALVASEVYANIGSKTSAQRSIENSNIAAAQDKPSVTAAVAAAYASVAYGESSHNIISFEEAMPTLPSRSARIMRIVNNAMPERRAKPIDSLSVQRFGKDESVEDGVSAMWASEEMPAYAVDDTNTSMQEVHEGIVDDYSADYIERLVRDEFDHRHDTTAQRNAALGQMRVVEGSVARPVPLDAGFKHLRHRA